MDTTPLSLTCSARKCRNTAPMICEGTTASGSPCTVAVCGQHRAKFASRWLCPACAATQGVGAPQLELNVGRAA